MQVGIRPREDYLSVTWLEHFSPDYEDGLKEAAEAIGRTLEVKGKDGFSVAEVGDVSQICASFDAKIRILHEPEDENTGHVAIRRFPRDDLHLLDLLAAEAFTDTRVASDVMP